MQGSTLSPISRMNCRSKHAEALKSRTTPCFKNIAVMNEIASEFQFDRLNDNLSSRNGHELNCIYHSNISTGIITKSV